MTDESQVKEHVVFSLPDGTQVSNDPLWVAKQQAEAYQQFLDQHPELRPEVAAASVQQESITKVTTNTGDANTLGRTPEPAGVEPDGGTPEPETPPEYETWSNDSLRAELVERGLDVNGKKDDLVARLRESDAASAE